jgi:hypothetical protein
LTHVAGLFWLGRHPEGFADLWWADDYELDPRTGESDVGEGSVSWFLQAVEDDDRSGRLEAFVAMDGVDGNTVGAVLDRLECDASRFGSDEAVLRIA